MRPLGVYGTRVSGGPRVCTLKADEQTQLTKKRRSRKKRPMRRSKSLGNLQGSFKSYWEDHKGTELRSLLREKCDKPVVNTVTPKGFVKKKTSSWNTITPVALVNKRPLTNHQRRCSSSWRDKASKLTTALPEDRFVPHTPQIWSQLTSSAVLQDRPASRGFTPGTPCLMRVKSAPELKEFRRLNTRIKNYDYFTKNTVLPAHAPDFLEVRSKRSSSRLSLTTLH